MGMKINFVRIDDRLVHGQVATIWSKHTKINRIIVVSDLVARDDLRKTLLVQAAPPEIKVNVITVDKMIELFTDKRLNEVQAMLLFTNPTDIVRLVNNGVEIKSVNIGGMSFTNGKQMITNAVAVDRQDIQAFQLLAVQQIELEIRKVVSDHPVLLMDLLKKEHLIE